MNRVFFIKDRTLCNWGGFSFVKAITHSLKEILSLQEKYEFINLLSAQDYPIKSNEFIYTFLKSHKGESFISYEISNKSSWWKHAVSRYELYHFTDINIKGKYLIQWFINKILPKRKFPLSCTLYGSAVSSWWTL